MRTATKRKPKMDLTRALSWSAIGSFEWDKEQWYESYVLGIRQTSHEMTFGSVIDKLIQNDKNFLPELMRYPLMQHKLNATFGKIPLVGLPDGLCLDTFLLADYKTGKKAWNQKRADETGQLTMYLFLIHLIYGIRPEKFRCFIHWLPTEEGWDVPIQLILPCRPVTIETSRTMKDLLEFGIRIKETYAAMQAYTKNHTAVGLP